MARSPEVESSIPQPETLSDPSLFVEDEQAFCNEYQATLERLPNGATIFTMPHRVEDTMHMEMEISFPYGSRFDPPGKQGLAHLTEHISSTGILAATMQTHNDFNATTTPISNSIRLIGIANPAYPSIGVWPILDMITTYVRDARNIDELNPDRVAREIETIQEEISFYELNHDLTVMKCVIEALYAKNHPYQANVLGTPEDLASITIPDIEKEFYHMRHPHGAVLHALVHAPVPMNAFVHEKLRQIAHALPTIEQPGTLPAPNEFDMAPTIKPGSCIVYNLGLESQLITVQLLWPLRALPRSTQYFAIEQFESLLEGHLFDFIRERGLAYTVESHVLGDNEPMTTVAVKFDTSKEKLFDMNLASFVKEFQDSLSWGIDDTTISTYVEHEHSYQKAVPPSIENRFELGVYGLQRFNRLINLDEIMRRYSNITPAHLMSVRDHVASHLPIMLLIGYILEK